jgi:hypothetical protein
MRFRVFGHSVPLLAGPIQNSQFYFTPLPAIEGLQNSVPTALVKIDAAQSIIGNPDAKKDFFRLARFKV